MILGLLPTGPGARKVSAGCLEAPRFSIVPYSAKRVLFFGDSPNFLSLQCFGLGPNGTPPVRASVLWLRHVA